MRAERVRQLTAQAQASAKRIEDARGAFAARPGLQAGSSSAKSALKRQARTLVSSRNEGETVLADAGEAREEIQTDLQRSQQESAEAQQAVATAEQEEGEAGLAAVGGRSSAGNNARARAQRAQASVQAAQEQAAELQEGTAPLEQEVQAASDTATLLSGYEGNEREAVATVLEEAERSEGPPRRKASKATILAGGLLGGGIGLGIGGLIGAGIGALAGTFLGSTAIGAAVGAGAGALLGGLFGSVAGGVVAARKGRTALPGRAPASRHDEGTYDNIDSDSDVAFAPDRLRALNAAAPAAVPLGSGGSFVDAGESVPADARAAGASIAAGAPAGRGGIVPSFRGSLAPVSEVDDTFYAGVDQSPGTASQPHSRSVSHVPFLPTVGQDDEGEAAAERQDAADRQAAADERQRQEALQAQRRLQDMGEEEGTAGGGAIAQRASLAAQADAGPQMSPEEMAIFEQGLMFKDSGRDAESVSGVPATAQAMFGTDKLTAPQSYSLQRKRLENSGQADVARLLAGPPTTADVAGEPTGRRKGRKARRPSSRVITDEMLDAPDPAPVPTITPAAEAPVQPQQAVIGGFESLSEENQAYYARLLSSDSGISPAQAMSMAQRRQAASAAQGAADQEPAGETPQRGVATYETAAAAPGFLSRAFGSVRGAVGDALLSAGVVDEFDGWMAPVRDEIAPRRPVATAPDASAPAGPGAGGPEQTPAPAPPPRMDSVLDSIDTSEAGKAKYTAQYHRMLHPEPTLEDWVDRDDMSVRGTPTQAPVPAASPAPSSGYGSGTSSPVPTPVASPVPTPVDPRSAVYSNMTGAEAAALGRQRGIAEGQARRQAAVDSQARTKARIENEQTWYGSAWEYFSSGLMTKEERDEERKRTRKQHRDEVANRWLS